MNDDNCEARFHTTTLDQPMTERARAISYVIEGEPPERRLLILLVTIFIEACVATGRHPADFGSAEQYRDALAAFVEDASVWVTSYLFPDAARKALGK